ncbi:hypothetical protein L226DRAFT_212663 [Lentinus tigrinus ALCF2SS1-7]|uniref:uncharacterized protein n=1 Tax=Lentinus tigrinus ALCF2SS1-7 TaxID=1328758 RepID=UPI001165FEE1|nr:hypothetical protein L226DRAFT_212663 [Lentinus tigrinus ALCF2SS1-7]
MSRHSTPNSPRRASRRLPYVHTRMVGVPSLCPDQCPSTHHELSAKSSAPTPFSPTRTRRPRRLHRFTQLRLYIAHLQFPANGWNVYTAPTVRDVGRGPNRVPGRRVRVLRSTVLPGSEGERPPTYVECMGILERGEKDRRVRGWSCAMGRWATLGRAGTGRRRSRTCATA